MKSIYLLLVITLTAVQLNAQDPVTKVWHAYNDGSLTGSDKAWSLTTDAAGNVFVTGQCYETTSQGQFTTIKYDSSGNELWQSDYTGASPAKSNRGNKIAIDNEGTVYAVGLVSDKGGDIGILKYNNDGLVWAEAYTPSWYGNYSDEGLDIGIDDEGNVYAIGRVTSTSGSFDDVYTFKIDADGELMWDVQFSENSATDYPSAIAVTGNGSVYSLSSSFNFWGSSNFDITTIHYNTDGIEQWISRYNGEGNDMDFSTDIAVNENDTQYVCGSTLNGDGNEDFVMMMQNEYGTRLWTERYNGSANENDTAFAIRFLNDGRAVVTGKSYEDVSGETVEAATTLMINTDGSIAWTDVYTGDENYGAAASSIAVDSLNGIYMAGYVNTSIGQEDGLLIKYNVDGEKEWQQVFDSEEHLEDIFNDIVLDNNLNILVTGHSFNSGTNSRYLTVKYSQEIIKEDTTGEDTTNTALTGSSINNLLLFPNPANSVVTVQLPDILVSGRIVIYDALGNACIEEDIKHASNAVQVNVSELPAGLYFIRVSDKERIYTGKFYAEGL